LWLENNKKNKNMPKKDLFHDTVRIALESDGWTVTHDPLRLEWQGVVYMPDLAAERVLAAERGEEKIAVEIKTFIGQIFQHEFYETLGQYDSYTLALADLEPDRQLLLAVPLDAYLSFFQRQYVKTIIAAKNIKLLVYNTQNQTIALWIK
jgi:hypothetical protein